MSNTINRHTPGPMTVPFKVAKTADEAGANARLFAAAYTAFDKAGRTLGIDAAELAESVDLVALVDALQNVTASLRNVMAHGGVMTHEDKVARRRLVADAEALIAPLLSPADEGDDDGPRP